MFYICRIWCQDTLFTEWTMKNERWRRWIQKNVWRPLDDSILISYNGRKWTYKRICWWKFLGVWFSQEVGSRHYQMGDGKTNGVNEFLTWLLLRSTDGFLYEDACLQVGTYIWDLARNWCKFVDNSIIRLIYSTWKCVRYLWRWYINSRVGTTHVNPIIEHI